MVLVSLQWKERQVDNILRQTDSLICVYCFENILQIQKWTKCSAHFLLKAKKKIVMTVITKPLRKNVTHCIRNQLSDWLAHHCIQGDGIYLYFQLAWWWAQNGDYQFSLNTPLRIMPFGGLLTSRLASLIFCATLVNS